MDPQTTQLFINIAYDKSKETESGAEKFAATQPSTMEETTDPRKLQLMLVSLMTMTVMKTTLIQNKIVNLVIMSFVEVLNSDTTAIF